MSSPARTVSPEDDIDGCCNVMEENQIRRVPVVDANGSCCGIFSQADIALKAGESETAEVVHDISVPAAGTSRARTQTG